MPEAQVQVRLARPDESAEIATLYAACYPTSVWAQLGAGVAEVYFSRFCTGPHELAVTARLDGALIGACLGTGRPGMYASRFYVENAGPLVAALAREATRRPSVFAVLARRLASGAVGRLAAGAALALGRQPRTERLVADLPLDAERTCYMADFFVLPSARGRQLGTAMLQRFGEEMAERGFEWCRVHTTSDNVASQVAQQRAGFQCVARRGRDLTFVARIGADRA